MPEPQAEELNETTQPVTEEAPQGPTDLDLLKIERDQLQGQLMRALADFQNFRKRTQTEKAQLESMILANFARDVLPALDNFERTLAAAESGASAESLVEGIAAVERQLRAAFEAKGLQRIPTVGEAFDPELHEAIGTDFTDEYDPDTVSFEVEPGYKMGDRVIRAARVRVALPS